eukprot:287835-Prorocentrum_minimum.AAC.1
MIGGLGLLQLRLGGRAVSDHVRLRVPSEGVLQHLGQHRCAEHARVLRPPSLANLVDGRDQPRERAVHVAPLDHAVP